MTIASKLRRSATLARGDIARTLTQLDTTRTARVLAQEQARSGDSDARRIARDAKEAHQYMTRRATRQLTRAWGLYLLAAAARPLERLGL